MRAWKQGSLHLLVCLSWFLQWLACSRICALRTPGSRWCRRCPGSLKSEMSSAQPYRTHFFWPWSSENPPWHHFCSESGYRQCRCGTSRPLKHGPYYSSAKFRGLSFLWTTSRSPLSLAVFYHVGEQSCRFGGFLFVMLPFLFILFGPMVLVSHWSLSMIIGCLSCRAGLSGAWCQLHLPAFHQIALFGFAARLLQRSTCGRRVSAAAGDTTEDSDFGFCSGRGSNWVYLAKAPGPCSIEGLLRFARGKFDVGTRLISQTARWPWTDSSPHLYMAPSWPPSASRRPSFSNIIARLSCRCSPWKSPQLHLSHQVVLHPSSRWPSRHGPSTSAQNRSMTTACRSPQPQRHDRSLQPLLQMFGPSLSQAPREMSCCHLTVGTASEEDGNQTL